ncbi:SDR family NAD(P)-dependent oxidoreductase [Chloroflexota bacterium]
MSKFSLAGKVAIVTGGGTGIGRGIALEFAKAGADVVVSSRRLAVLEEVAEEIRASGKRSLAVQTDISRKSDVDSMVERVVDEFGGIDILVNNAAALTARESLLNLREEDWDKVIDTNLKGCYFCCQAVGKRMVEGKKGNIINVVSFAGMQARTMQRGAYGISKAGVVMLTRVLALELASSNVRVNAIAPSSVRTELTRSSWSDPESESFKQYLAQVPMGRIAEVNDITGVALFLASDASSYITGQAIVVDGGQRA